MNPLLVHLEPQHREAFLQGDLMDPQEIQIVDLRGAWDEDTFDFALTLQAQGKQVYLYLQVATSPLTEWRNAEPHRTMGDLPTIPLVQSWAYGRDAIDWSRVQLPLAASVTLPPGAGVMLDNYFPELQPWMFGRGDWSKLPSLPVLKRKSYTQRLRAFLASVSERTIVNGIPHPEDPATWVMVERAAARRYEAEQRATQGNTILSIVAEEYYNLPWVLDLWTRHDGNALSFTSDSSDPVVALYAYQRAIQWRKDHA